ncbi:MAG: hypothetical protein ACYDER_18485 [Ktedonobacteraceae bacterium]
MMMKRLLFLCARGSSRAYLAASMLAAIAATSFDVWATPTQEEQGLVLAEQVLQELAIKPVARDHLVQPTFGMHWDEGIVLCSGATDT